MLNPSDKELDRLSREAAGQFEPDQSLSSWEKLEPLLDQELGTGVSNPPARPGSLISPLRNLAVIIVACTASLILLIKTNSGNSHPGKSSAAASASLPASQPKAADKGTSSHAGSQGQPATKHLTSEGVTANSAASGSSAGIPSGTGASDEKQKVSILHSGLPAAGTAPVNPVSGPALRKSLTDPSSTGSASNAKAIHASTHRDLPAGDRAPGSPSLSHSSDSINSSDNRRAASHKTNISDLTGVASSGSSGLTSDSRSGNKLHSDDLNRRRGISPQNDRSIVLNPPAPLTDSRPSTGFSAQASSATAVNQRSFSAATGPVKLPLPKLAQIDQTVLRIGLSQVPSTVASALPATGPRPASRSLRINRSLHIGAMVAPDVTNVGSAYDDKLSSNFGLTVGYQLFGSLSINSGFIFTKKNYAANGYDFHVPANSNLSWAHIAYVQGNCRMYEIPLTLRYDYSSIGKTLFFFNAGLSSYLMRHESYDYYFPVWGGLAVDHVDYSDRKNYWFSMVNLSMGVEYTLSNSLSLQVEPFLKIPLTGVGVGSLELNSYGMSFLLRYSPVLAKSRK